MIKKLFNSELRVVNVGLISFKDTLDERGVKTVQVEWKPPVSVAPEAAAAIASKKTTIEKANLEVLKRIVSGKPALIGMGKALDTIPGMKKNLILHAGPPITWEKMCGPMKGAIIGALIYEGMAKDEKEATALASSGNIEYSPCHEHQTVGPMAGIVSPGMPVFIIENSEFGNHAYTTQNEGLGKVLRYGAFGDEVIKKLKWMEAVLYPTLKQALSDAGRIDLRSIIAQALHMGDEVHNRNRAATSLLFRQLAPHIAKSENAGQVLGFINSNDHFFLNLSMAASKAMLDPAQNIENSSIVTIMARNGTDFGIKLSGTGSEWFTGTAPVPDALFFPGYTKEDANPDIGDSAITETAGLGGFAIAAAPAIVQFVGGSSKDAVNYTLAMYEICSGESNAFQIPYLDFRGTPTGIDVVKVVEKNITPFIDTGVAHKKPGIGQVGAGVLSAPVEPFKKAYEGLARKLMKTKRR
ncbi:MAG: DUF1116 domain-containing protein [Oligoflexales bacterium]|nr:DUF1116 domain-containing protein [Oligoflexales bacterium]